MIVFFTGTGNSMDVARIIAERTGDTLVDMRERYKNGNFALSVSQGEDFGIVFPVYRWSTPRIVDEFFRKATFVTDDGMAYKPGYAYAVDVYGYFPGAEVDYLDALLKKEQGFGLDASFEVPSVANCIYVSNPPSPKRASEQIEQERLTAAEVANCIASQEKVLKAKGIIPGRLLSKATGTQEKPRSTAAFKVNSDRCTSCGTCVRVCPTNTIVLNEGLPAWAGNDCTECLACIHRCPTEAIEFGFISKGRRRYRNPILQSKDM